MLPCPSEACLALRPVGLTGYIDRQVYGVKAGVEDDARTTRVLPHLVVWQTIHNMREAWRAHLVLPD